jgi:hypothetical protein
VARIHADGLGAAGAQAPELGSLRRLRRDRGRGDLCDGICGVDDGVGAGYRGVRAVG